MTGRLELSWEVRVTAPSNPTGIRVGMSTASVFPEPLASAFELAAAAGYDGLEILVQAEIATQDATTLRALIDRCQLPVLSIHSPCLLITSAVWSTDPLVKLSRSIELAEAVGASTVVVHPPFMWQRAAAGHFTESVAELQHRTDVLIAVENMFPMKVGRRASMNAYRPHWDPTGVGHEHYTLDLSHTATAGSDALDMLARMGSRLAHLHLTDGSGSSRDEHLVPGRGAQPCAEVLAALAAGTTGLSGYAARGGQVVVEISTRQVAAEQRTLDLAQALAFARWHLSAPADGASTGRLE